MFSVVVSFGVFLCARALQGSCNGKFGCYFVAAIACELSEC